MGRKKKLKALTNWIIWSLLFFPSFCFPQATVKGKILDHHNNAISFSHIIVSKDSLAVMTYAYADEEGDYEIQVEEPGKIVLQFSALGFYNKSISVPLSEAETVVLDVVLEEKTTNLDEVIIRAEVPIKIKKDTVAFRARAFSDGTENTVEDLLRKIPGLKIDDEGTIKIGNQEIQKLMVDGDDFFEKGYKLLSKNMPAYPIEEIEVLKNFSNNALLQSIEETDNVAVNLKLNEQSKRVWFGNVEGGIGKDQFHEFRSNFMNFGVKNKFYFLTNLNNTGYDATGNIKNLIKPIHQNEPGNIGDNIRMNNFVNLIPATPILKKERINFNNSKLVSINSIFNPSENLKIKGLSYFWWNENDFFRKTIDVVDIEETKFINTEDYHLRKESGTTLGKLDITYNISQTQKFEATTTYHLGNFQDNSNFLFNENLTVEDLEHRKKNFDQKINYTRKLKDSTVFLLTGRFLDEKSPQIYHLNRSFYPLFHEFENLNNVRQKSSNQMKFGGVSAHLLNRKNNGDLLELKLGNEYRKDKLAAAFSLWNQNVLLAYPDEYQHQTIYEINDLYFKGKYHYNFKSLAFTGNVDFHQLFTYLNNNLGKQSQKPFYITPKLGIEWRINDKNKITSSYSYNIKNTDVLDVYNKFALTGYRSFSKGLGTYELLESSNFTLTHDFGNWGERFFANTFFLYTKNHDFISTNSFIQQNFVQSQKILIHDRSFLSLNSTINYYSKIISSTLKLDLGYSQSEFKNIINNSGLRKVKFTSYRYGAELRSGFLGGFNYHIGTKWTVQKASVNNERSFTTNESFLDLSVILNKKIDIQLESELYHTGKIDGGTFTFLDFDFRYKLIPNKLTIGLTGKNLFDTDTFINYSVSDIGISTTEYRLLPRFVLFKTEYRF